VGLWGGAGVRTVLGHVALGLHSRALFSRINTIATAGFRGFRTS
jgi:hypothetical protein